MGLEKSVASRENTKRHAMNMGMKMVFLAGEIDNSTWASRSVERNVAVKVELRSPSLVVR